MLKRVRSFYIHGRSMRNHRKNHMYSIDDVSKLKENLKSHATLVYQDEEYEYYRLEDVINSKGKEIAIINIYGFKK